MKNILHCVAKCLTIQLKRKGGKVTKKPLQFQVSENFRAEIEKYAEERDMTLSEFLRQSVRLNMILSEYLSQGYKLTLKSGDEKVEKEIIFP